jgi:hypothetical protein
LRGLLVIEPDVAVQRRLQLFAASEVVALQHLFDAAIETLEPMPGKTLKTHEREPVGLRRLGRGQAVLNIEVREDCIEIVLASCGTLA